MAPRNRIAEVLLKAKVLDELQVRSAFGHTERWGGRLTKTLLEMGLADEGRVTAALAAGLGVKHIPLDTVVRDGGALARIDAKFAAARGVFPMALRDGGKTLHVAVADPTDVELQDELGRMARARVVLYVAGEEELTRAISLHYKNQAVAAGTESLARHAVRRATETIPVIKSNPSAVPDDEGLDEPFLLTHAHDESLAAGSGMPKGHVERVAPAEGSAAELLDGLLREAPTAATFTLEDLERLAQVRTNQDKSAAILRAVQSLLTDKGFRR